MSSKYHAVIASAIQRIFKIDPIQRQSLISLTNLIVITGVGFLSTMYFAHVLGPAVYGAYSLFLAYFFMFNLIAEGGLSHAAVKRISEGVEQNKYFSAYSFMRICLCILSLVILFLFRDLFIDLNTTGLFPFLYLAILVTCFNNIFSTAVYGLQKVGVQQTASMFNEIVRIIIQVLAVFLGFAAFGLAGGFVTGFIIGGILCIPFNSLRLEKFSKPHVVGLFTFSIWIFLSSVGSTIFGYTDRILIGYFMTNTEVGIYSIVFQFTAAATFTTIALQTTLFPKFSNMSATGTLNKISPLLSRAFTYSLLLAVPVCIGGWLLGERLLYFFYGSDFSSGAPVLTIILLMQIFNVFMFLQTMTLNAINKPKFAFYVTAISATLNVILNLLLIPLFGIIGAALATLFTMGLNAILAYIVLKKYVPVRLERKPTQHILAAAVLMAISIILFRAVVPLTNVFFVLLVVGAGAVIYFFILLKIDTGIHDELKHLTNQFGLGKLWPNWL